MFLNSKTQTKEKKKVKKEKEDIEELKKINMEDDDENQDNEEMEKKRNRDKTDLQKLEANLTTLLFDEDEMIEKMPKKVKKEEETLLKEAWKDGNLDEITIDNLKGSEYEEELRRKFLILNPYPKWALKSPKDMNELFSTTEKMIESNSNGNEYQKISDIDTIIKGKISSLSFHPNSNIIQISDATNVRLFQIDGNNNLLLEKYDINGTICTKFISDKELICIKEKSNGFSLIDIVKGNISAVNEKVAYRTFTQSENLLAFGSKSTSIHLFSRKTKFKVSEVIMNHPVNQISFSKDSNYLYGVGDSYIYIWDVRKNNRPISVHQDPGSIQTLGLSVCNKFYATGDKSGVVNLYKNEAKTPFKVFMNLVTQVDLMEFSRNETVLAYGSSKKENTLRILNLNNFQITPLKAKSIDDLSFSYQDDFLSVASKNRATLYKKC